MIEQIGLWCAEMIDCRTFHPQHVICFQDKFRPENCLPVFSLVITEKAQAVHQEILTNGKMVTKQQKKHHLKPQRKSPNRYMVKIVIVTRQYYWAAGEKLHSVSSVLNSNGTCCSEGSSVFKKIKEGLKVYNYGGRIRREARSLVGQWNPHPPPPTNWQPSPQAPSH